MEPLHEASLDASIEVPAIGGLAPVPLTRELLTYLQLVSRGHAPTEIAHLRRQSPGDVIVQLHEATLALGASTLREAIATAQERGLIL
jgi:hypothetical protein